jgi:hypothetical protein
MSGVMVRPRPWVPLDVMFLTRGSIETLGERFKAAGPLTVIALVAEATAAIGGGKRADFDVLEWRYTSLARRVYTDAATAKQIIHAADDLGLVEVLDEPDADRFKLRLLRWKDWHPKDPLAAARKKRERTRNAS